MSLDISPTALEVQLSDLHLLTSLLEDLDLPRAAERLGVSEPELAAAIGRLESGLAVAIAEARRATEPTRFSRRPRGTIAFPLGPASTMALSEAADMLGVSASTLRRWADIGRLRVVRTAGGHRRFAAADVQRLHRQTMGRRPPLLRPARPPEASMPELALLVEEEGRDLLQRAAERIYEPGREGWFAGGRSAGDLETWLRALHAAAADVLEWDAAFAATRELAAAARSGGAIEVEAHVLLDRIDDLVQLRLRKRGASHAAVAQARHLMRALHRAILDSGDAEARVSPRGMPERAR